MNNLEKVIYTYGLLEGMGKINTVDTVDDVLVICEKVLKNWNNKFDILNEEEGYIMEYATRVLVNMFSK